jgi:peptide/nickel transport system permease protein
MRAKATQEMFAPKSSGFLKLWQLKIYPLKLKLRGFPVIYGLIIALFILTAIFGRALTPYSATEPNLPDKFLPPFFQANGSLVHPLGTDMLGRDILSRIMVGARSSLIIAIMVVVLGGVGGSALGIISGYHGGKVDMLLMRVADATLAFPIILVAILLAITLGPSIQNVIIAISIIIWSRYARVIRGEVLSVKERDFVAMARVAGASGSRIMLKHIFPNVVHTLLVMVTLQVGTIIITEATLSFLGAGVPPPEPVWGSMISEGRRYIVTEWWISFFPGLALALVVLSFNMIGDWLREVLDPKLRQVGW